MITAFARMAGMAVGIVANNPMQLAGCLDIDASRKASPLRALLRRLQHPGGHLRGRARFLPGVHQEYGGIITHGSKLIYAYCEATVPLITVITRKAYGGAYDVMGSKHHGADVNLAYGARRPSVAVMGPEGGGEHRLPQGDHHGQGEAEDKDARALPGTGLGGVPPSSGFWRQVRQPLGSGGRAGLQ